MGANHGNNSREVFLKSGSSLRMLYDFEKVAYTDYMYIHTHISLSMFGRASLVILNLMALGVAVLDIGLEDIRLFQRVRYHGQWIPHR